MIPRLFATSCGFPRRCPAGSSIWVCCFTKFLPRGWDQNEMAVVRDFTKYIHCYVSYYFDRPPLAVHGQISIRFFTFPVLAGLKMVKMMFQPDDTFG